MKEIANKLRLIYKPFVLIAIGFILTYTFLHWILFIKAGISLKEEVIKYWLPFVLIWIPILIYLRPRIKLLHFNHYDTSFFYLALASFAIAIPTIISQEYLITATGKLTELDNVYQISQYDKTKFYSLKNYHISKQFIAIHTTQKTVHTKGIGNKYLTVSIYIAMPILENNMDIIKFENKYWLGKKYQESIDDSFFSVLSDKEKKEKYNLFLEKSLTDFLKTDFDKFTYLEVIGNTIDHDEYNNALKKFGRNLTDDSMVFEAKIGCFEARNDKKRFWFFCSLGIGLLTYFVFLLFHKIKE